MYPASRPHGLLGIDGARRLIERGHSHTLRLPLFIVPSCLEAYLLVGELR